MSGNWSERRWNTLILSVDGMAGLYWTKTLNRNSEYSCPGNVQLVSFNKPAFERKLFLMIRFLNHILFFLVASLQKLEKEPLSMIINNLKLITIESHSPFSVRVYKSADENSALPCQAPFPGATCKNYAEYQWGIKESPAAGDSLHLYFTNLSDGRESLLLLRCNFSLQRVQREI